MTFMVFSLCPANSVLIFVAGKIKVDSDSRLFEYVIKGLEN